MKNILLFCFVLFFISCDTKPQPLIAGKDDCSFCKMPVADTKFGGEIITSKGKIYKFDDVICMIHFMNAGLKPNEKIKNIFAVSYTNNIKLMDVEQTFFLVSSQFHTSMNSGTACFESLKDAETYQENFPGNILSWREVQQTLK